MIEKMIVYAIILIVVGLLAYKNLFYSFHMGGEKFEPNVFSIIVVFIFSYVVSSLLLVPMLHGDLPENNYEFKYKTLVYSCIMTVILILLLTIFA